MDFSKHLQKADEAMRRRNWDFAIEVYQHLLSIDADLGEARSGLRQALKRRAEQKKSSKLFRAAMGAMPLAAAKALLKTHKFDAAAKSLETYLSSNPIDPEGNLLLGMALEGAGHLKSARAVYEFLADVAPNNSEGLKRAGAMMFKTGDALRALEYYERALKADPRDQEALKARKDLSAEAALKKANYETAVHSRDLIKDKDSARELEVERRRHFSDEDLKTELAKLEARFAESPSDPDVMMRIADVHERLHDVDAAAEFAERASSYRKESFEFASRAGDLGAKALKKAMARADKEGDAEQAAAVERQLVEHELGDYKRRVALRPNEPALRLELGKRLMRANELDAALGELQKAHGEARIRREALFWMAQCFQKKGFGDLAKRQYQAALEGTTGVDERAKEILYNLGAIAEAEGQTAEARACYARVYAADIGYRDVAGKMQQLR